MRVIAGKAKGKRIKALSGLRPTSELVRGAIFSMVEPMVSGWSRIADLYAGSGAMGIEALSRGAEWGDFVEQDPRRCALIRENLQRTGLADRANIYCCKVSKAITFLDGKYNLIIIDPPYTGTSISDILERIATSKLVGEGSIIVVEHSSRVSLNSSYGDLGLKRHKRHGDSCISVYQ